MRSFKNWRTIVHGAMFFLESFVLAFIIGIVVLEPVVHYTHSGESFQVMFEAEQDEFFNDLDHVTLFCGTKAEPILCKDPKQAVVGKLFKQNQVYEAVFRNVPNETFRFRLEFIFKEGITDTERWPLVKVMRFGDYALGLNYLNKYNYQGERPSYECRRMVECPFGGNLLKIVLIGFSIFSFILLYGFYSVVVKAKREYYSVQKDRLWL